MGGVYNTKVRVMSVDPLMIDENNLTAEVLNLLNLLIKYGYYANLDDIKKLIPLLVSLLNDESVKLFHEANDEKERLFKENKENAAVWKMRCKALEVMDSFFNFQFYLKLQHFIYDYRVLRENIDPNKVEKAKPENADQPPAERHRFNQSIAVIPQHFPHIKSHVMQHFPSIRSKRDYYSKPPPLLQKLEQHPHELKICGDKNEDLRQETIDRLQYLFSRSDYKCDAYAGEKRLFSDILINLSKYPNIELLHESLHLLGRMYSTEEYLFEKAIQTQLLITDQSKNVYDGVLTKLPKLRHHAAVDASEEQHSELVEILENFTKLCHLDGDETQPHKQNQKILYNTGVFSDIVNLIFRDESRREITSDDVKSVSSISHHISDKKKRKEILAKCMQFLRSLAKDNVTVQERLFNHMDDFLKLDVAIPQMADLLSEVFTGELEICLKIKEHQVHHVFHLIAYGGIVGRDELLRMLQAVVKVEKLNLPIKRNQGYVIKYFGKMREKFCNHLLGLEKEKVEKRGEVLIRVDSFDPELQLLLKLFDLLASCSEGENLFVESVCQNSMGITEVLKILSMPDLDPLRKKPFVRFLLWVYMTTGGDKIQTGSTILHHDRQMWSFLKQTHLLLDNLVKTLPKFKVASAKHHLTSRSIRTSEGIRKSTTANSTALNSLHMHANDENGELIPGSLTYLMEAILPMFKIYFKEYFIPHDTYANADGNLSPVDEIQISSDIVCSLISLTDVIKHFLTSQEQWVLLHKTIDIISDQICFENILSKLDPEVKERYDKSTTTDNITLPALKEYKRIYLEEIKLNDMFNNFVRNYELAYWGPNTANYQIDSTIMNKEYSQFKDDFLDEKGDEWLPLGKSFQKHVKLYMSCSLPPDIKIQKHTERVIDYLESSYNKLTDLDEREHQRQDKMNIRYLHLLRALIHNQVKFVDDSLKEEGQNPKLFRLQCMLVELVQNQIQELGNTAKRIAKLLTHPNDNISAEVLAFLLMLLYNGNRNVQEGFDYLRKTREENLFISMQQRLQQAILNETERRALLAQLESHMNPQEILEVFSRRSTLYGSTDSLLDVKETSKRCSVSPDEPYTFSSTQHLCLSGPVYEMQPLRGAYYGHSSITDLSSEERRKRSFQLTEAESPKHITDGVEKVNSLKFKDTCHIELAVGVLGLMCDGQYRPLQNYLRVQPDNIKSVNLVSEICTFLSSFCVDITKDNIKLINSTLQTLIEMSVGNYANQEVLYYHQIIDVINHILQITDQQCSTNELQELQEYEWQVLKLKQLAITLLEVMCEETHEKTEILVEKIKNDIDIDAIHKTFGYFCKLSKKKKVKDDAERAVFRTYHVIMHMADFKEIPLSSVEPKLCESKDASESECKEAWDNCKKWSRSIEVVYKNDEKQKVLARVHFRLHETDELPEELKEKVKYNVNRDSADHKIRDFSKWMEAAKKEIDHLAILRRGWCTNALVWNLKWRNRILIFWTLLMNIMLIIAWSDVDLKSGYVYSPPEDELTDPMLSGYCLEAFCYSNTVDNSTFASNLCDPNYCKVTKTLVPTLPRGSIHLLMSLAMVISYFLINSGNFVLPGFFHDFCKNALQKFPPDSCRHKILKRLQLNTPCEYADEPLFGLRALYHIVFVVCSALSLSFYGYFYCVCLLHIVIDNDILQRVLKSVTKNGRSLLWVGALGLVVLYIYSVGTFAFLPNEFHEPDPEEPGENVRFCRSLIQCFISVLEYGLLDTLGSTADLPMNFNDAAIRTVFFDLTFFVIVTTIGLNIVFGIIVDTFSELRDERYKIEDDMKQFCFICGNPSHDFERKAKGFDHHVKNEHCMWNYIYFYLHLTRIDINDHNAIESYVWKQIREEKTEFFPLFEAKCLKGMQDETLTKLSKLDHMVTKLTQHFEHQEKLATLHRKREEQAQWVKKIAENQ